MSAKTLNGVVHAIQDGWYVVLCEAEVGNDRWHHLTAWQVHSADRPLHVGDRVVLTYRPELNSALYYARKAAPVESEPEHGLECQCPECDPLGLDAREGRSSCQDQ
jgi:hypothetical protein